MDKETAEEEAFMEYSRTILGPKFDIYKAWKAACKYQRERDAEICLNEHVEADITKQPEDRAYNIACNHCADAILNQGSKE